MMFIIWIPILWVIYYLVKNEDGFSLKGSNNAIEVLKQRYVNGEIDEIAYLTMMKNIKK